jgi:CubicO group peptidase (beta-lactamase class C family)
VFANGGRELDLREETLKQLMAPPIPPIRSFHDQVVKVDFGAFSLGFMKPIRKNSFANLEAFGAPGQGGSFGFADPKARVGYAYVPNRFGTYLLDPREISVRNAMHRSIGQAPIVT